MMALNIAEPKAQLTPRQRSREGTGAFTGFKDIPYVHFRAQVVWEVVVRLAEVLYLIG